MITPLDYSKRLGPEVTLASQADGTISETGHQGWHGLYDLAVEVRLPLPELPPLRLDGASLS